MLPSFAWVILLTLWERDSQQGQQLLAHIREGMKRLQSCSWKPRFSGCLHSRYLQCPSNYNKNLHPNVEIMKMTCTRLSHCQIQPAASFAGTSFLRKKVICRDFKGSILTESYKWNWPTNSITNQLGIPLAIWSDGAQNNVNVDSKNIRYHYQLLLKCSTTITCMQCSKSHHLHSACRWQWQPSCPDYG